MAGPASFDFGGIGGAVSDVFGGIGALKAAGGYKTASKLAAQNAVIEAASTRVRQLQAQRQIYQVIGGQQADVAAAGFAKSGSALDLLRSSAEQGSLTKALVEQQGAINVAGYKAQAAMYGAQASASKTSGIGGIISGVAKGIFSIFSDARLKRDIDLVCRRPDGLGVYTFKYLIGQQKYLGLIAQEVLEVYPEAVVIDEDTGYLKVRYDMLDCMVMPVGNC